jgi:mannose-6-phosphate isomerase
MNQPLRFVPFLRPMVWGGRHLGEVLGKPLPTDEPYGESWEISDHPLHYSVVASGPLQGQTLRQLMQTHRRDLLPPDVETTTFPLLVKYLDARDLLSVQVHPDEEAVKRLWPGEGSKTEAWFVLDAAPGSRIYAGLLPGVGEHEMRAGLDKGTVAGCLHSFEPKQGDCVFLPAGTVHAVGGGVLMAEIQQTSDATFRLFDWNRRDAQGNMRKLHIEEGLASIHWDQGPVTPRHVAAFGREVTAHRQSLVRCRHFELEFVRAAAPFSVGGQGQAVLLLVVAGDGRLAGLGGEESLQRGQTLLLPAAAPPMEVRPAGVLSLLHCTIPLAISSPARSASAGSRSAR